MKLTQEQLRELIKKTVAAGLEKELKALARMPGPGTMRDIMPHDGEDGGSDFFEEPKVEKGPSGFYGMMDFFRTVAKAPADARLVPASTKALEEGNPESAGILVPIEYSGTIIHRTIETGKILQFVQVVPMRSSEMKTPVALSEDESSGELYGGVKFAWTDEGGEKPLKDFKLGMIGLKARTLAAICKCSNQLLEDSSPRAEQIIRTIFSASYGNTIENVILNGTGAGQPKGIINHAGAYTVTKETGQAASTIVWNNCKKMRARLWENSQDSPGLRWLINPSCLDEILSLNQPVGTGGNSVIIASGEGVRPVPQKLLGIPIVWTSHAAALGSKGDCVLADLGMYILGIRRELSVAVSQHIYFTTNYTALRFEGRVDGMPVNATTFKSRTNYETSPFVVLGARA